MSALGHKRTFAVQNAMSALPPIADISAFITSSARASTVPGTSRPHLAVRLSKSHMTMGGGSDKSIDGRGDTSDHRRQQRDWP